MTVALSVIQQSVRRTVRTLGLAPAARVLDAPCGAAALTTALLDDGLAAIGADIDDSARTVLRDAFAHADLEATLPWGDGAFDAICSVEGI